MILVQGWQIVLIIKLVPGNDQHEPVDENSLAGIGGIIIYARRVQWLGEVKRTFKSPESVQKSFMKAVSEADLKGTDVTHTVRCVIKSHFSFPQP